MILDWTKGRVALEFLRNGNLCFTPALTFYPLPQERKWLLAGFGFADDRPAKSVARMFEKAANDSPSPWRRGPG
jgi:hypothetical protein